MIKKRANGREQSGLAGQRFEKMRQ